MLYNIGQLNVVGYSVIQYIPLHSTVIQCKKCNTVYYYVILCITVCYYFTMCPHSYSTSLALPWHYLGTSLTLLCYFLATFLALPWHFLGIVLALSWHYLGLKFKAEIIMKLKNWETNMGRIISGR